MPVSRNSKQRLFQAPRLTVKSRDNARGTPVDDNDDVIIISSDEDDATRKAIARKKQLKTKSKRKALPAPPSALEIGCSDAEATKGSHELKNEIRRLKKVSALHTSRSLA
jgi:hypothetical protein